MFLLNFPRRLAASDESGQRRRGFSRRVLPFPAMGKFIFATIMPISLYAQAVPASISVGSYPNSVVINPVTNTIHVANEGSSNVPMLDNATNTVTAVVPTGNSPKQIAVNQLKNSGSRTAQKSTDQLCAGLLRNHIPTPRDMGRKADFQLKEMAENSHGHFNFPTFTQAFPLKRHTMTVCINAIRTKT